MIKNVKVLEYDLLIIEKILRKKIYYIIKKRKLNLF